MQYTQPRRTLSPQDLEEQQRLREEREAALRLKNNRLGITMFQISWIMIFVCLIVVNWQMRFSPDWMLNGAVRPDAALPTIATVALLASTVLVWQALKAIQADKLNRFMGAWLGAIGLGAAFFIIMLTQLNALPSDEGQYVFVYRLMIGYHALHALAIGVMMVQVYRYAQAKRYHAQHHWPVEATVKLWYFVTVAWIMFYIVLYII